VKTRSGRGLGFVLILAVIIFGLISGAVALTTGRKCSDKGLAREWVFFPPHWECQNGPFVVN
jgi:hypothetical protein